MYLIPVGTFVAAVVNRKKPTHYIVPTYYTTHSHKLPICNGASQRARTTYVYTQIQYAHLYNSNIVYTYIRGKRIY